MSFAPRSVPLASSSTHFPFHFSPRPPHRHLATPAPPSLRPPLRASLILSRPPLLTRTPNPLESTYHAHSLSIRHALSNPPSTEFYFRPDSLPLRRFLVAEHAQNEAIYGKQLAGDVPEVGDLPGEIAVDEIPRDKWEKEDAGRGEKSLERIPEEEVFCLVKNKDGGGSWEFPSVEVGVGEGLHEAVERGLVGVDGGLGGKGMDTWLVARKPVGVMRDGDARTFFLRSHILAGEPLLASTAPWSVWAWLTAREVEGRLGQVLWEGVRGMFGQTAAVEHEQEDAE